MKIIKLLSIVLIATLISCTTMNDSKEKRVSAFVKKAMNSVGVVPSLSVAIVDSTGIVMTKAFGYADVENNIEATKKTNYYIASTTKSFVGLLAVILNDEGRISLEENITSYKPFKEFKNNEVFKNIAVKDLLSHQSGLDNGFLSFRLAYSGSYSREDILRIIENETFLRDEGKEFQYTNLGYYLYSVLLKEELGMEWQDLLDEKVFTPLDMDLATAYISDSPKELLAQPYYGSFLDSVKKASTHKTDETMHAAGGLIMNAEDVANFLLFYINNGHMNNQQIYPQTLVEKSYHKEADTGNDIPLFNANGYGMGWLLGEIKGEDMVNHLGGYIGYKAIITFFPEKKLGVAVFTNHQELGRSLGNSISNFVYELYLGDPKNINDYENTLLTELMATLKDKQKDEIEEEKKWGKPEWQLSLSKKAYTGSFYNDKDGTITITIQNGDLVIKNGNLTCIGEPHFDKDCIQVELISTSRKTICFNIEGEEVTSIFFRDKNWLKIN